MPSRRHGIERQPMRTLRSGRSAELPILKKGFPTAGIRIRKQDSSTVARLLEESFDQIRQATDSLGDKNKERIEKAWRVTEKMTATIAFFFCMIESLVTDMNLSHDNRELMHNHLIPGFYLEKVSQKEKDSERKQRIRQRALELLSVLTDRNGPLSKCDDREITRMMKKAILLFKETIYEQGTIILYSA
jgi:DNA-directed RNA polymerase specialized sigma subunit